MDLMEIDFKRVVIRTYENLWVILSAIVTVIALAYSEEFQRMFPTNLIVLTVFTLVEGVFIGRVGQKYHSKTVRSLFMFNLPLASSLKNLLIFKFY